MIALIYFTFGWICLAILFLCFANMEESDEEADARIANFDNTPNTSDEVEWPNW